MSIKSTMQISRKDAINRIVEIQRLVASHNFYEVESITYDPEYDIRKFFNSMAIFDVSQWTNTMLGDLLDTPFFRFSMFDNYLVIDEL